MWRDREGDGVGTGRENPPRSSKVSRISVDTCVGVRVVFDDPCVGTRVVVDDACVGVRVVAVNMSSGVVPRSDDCAVGMMLRDVVTWGGGVSDGRQTEPSERSSSRPELYD